MHPLAVKMVKAYMKRLGGSVGCVIVEGDSVEFLGGADQEGMLRGLGEKAKEVFSLIREAYGLSMKAEPRILVAEGDSRSVAFARVSDGLFIVSFYSYIPTGTVIYETRRLIFALREFMERLGMGEK